ncbi:hypothetical protein GDO78_022663, partial [Eleutherodactylus coqui]
RAPPPQDTFSSHTHGACSRRGDRGQARDTALSADCGAWGQPGTERIHRRRTEPASAPHRDSPPASVGRRGRSKQVMFAKGKGSAVPSDGQAREKLALYVYEYLLHVGAQKSAQTFLSEIRWEKNITLGEPPGFLHSWWCVFWDLYCAAPERRDTCEHSSEAKAFHDYVSRRRFWYLLFFWMYFL